ncbi:GntR family transcriptional regulator [Marinibacterium profundimaris]|uniref:GntR family transcriptional regulator n=1 Tax=Marinibacterium profundimaris TaxID=1679460 RepID=UPI0013037B12|nr:GntR family transcriptional regulator [Marinibacterium profundimaris]
MAAGGALLASDHAYAVIRRDILLGVFPPGTHLRFAELRRRYDIGASPLREALFRLTSEHLVLQESNRGFRVPQLSRTEWADVVAMRRRLEPAAAEASILAGSEDWEEELLLAHRRLKRLGPPSKLVRPLAQASSSAQWEDHHRTFHATLISACGSPWTMRFIGLLSDQFDRYRRFAMPAPAVQEVLAGQHDEMLEAALAREGWKAREVLDAHIQMTCDAVGEALKRIL